MNPTPAPFVRCICEHVFVQRVSFTKAQLREAVATSGSYNDTLRKVGLRPAGGNYATVKKYIRLWEISVDHFPKGGRYPRGGRDPIPLEEVLVVGSTYHRAMLKRRLYEAGLKSPACELCSQGEIWQGKRMAMILDHVNGDATDNRLENLRIVCANCNATLETHCGRNKPRGRPPQECEHCAELFRAQNQEQRFCSRACSSATNGPRSRRAVRPPLDELLGMIDSEGYEAVGRRYELSGNAIRKWVKAYGVEPPPGPGRDFNPPPCPAPVLSDDEARCALALLASGSSMYEVAPLFGVSKMTIRQLRDGVTYRHLERPAAKKTAA